MTTDDVTSYFAMRKISLCKDDGGAPRLCLNNRPLFQVGPLDQGWWPDGLYTAPTDEALRYDIEVTKQLGFNMARKHVKVEPDRWYYWADTLGLLVWQDMPSTSLRGTRTPESARQFELELKAMIDEHRNHPSIVMWVPFNEGWGQYDTPRIVAVDQDVRSEPARRQRERLDGRGRRRRDRRPSLSRPRARRRPSRRAPPCSASSADSACRCPATRGRARPTGATAVLPRPRR